MNIHANRGQVKAHGDCQIRRLAPDTWQFAKFLNGLWKNAAKPLTQDVWQRLQMPRLRMIKADRENKFFNLLNRKPLKISRRKQAFLFCRAKKASHRTRGARIFRPRRKDRSNKHAKGIVRLRLNELDDRRGMLTKRAREGAVNRRDCARRASARVHIQRARVHADGRLGIFHSPHLEYRCSTSPSRF